jgi:hypothetical protein
VVPARQDLEDAAGDLPETVSDEGAWEAARRDLRGDGRHDGVDGWREVCSVVPVLGVDGLADRGHHAGGARVVEPLGDADEPARGKRLVLPHRVRGSFGVGSDTAWHELAADGVGHFLHGGMGEHARIVVDQERDVVLEDLLAVGREHLWRHAADDREDEAALRAGTQREQTVDVARDGVLRVTVRGALARGGAHHHAVRVAVGWHRVHDVVPRDVVEVQVCARAVVLVGDDDDREQRVGADEALARAVSPDDGVLRVTVPHGVADLRASARLREGDG